MKCITAAVQCMAEVRKPIAGWTCRGYGRVLTGDSKGSCSPGFSTDTPAEAEVDMSMGGPACTNACIMRSGTHKR